MKRLFPNIQSREVVGMGKAGEEGGSSRIGGGDGRVNSKSEHKHEGCGGHTCMG